jgi:hypothetical protein
LFSDLRVLITCRPHEHRHKESQRDETCDEGTDRLGRVCFYDARPLAPVTIVPVHGCSLFCSEDAHVNPARFIRYPTISGLTRDFANAP